MKINDQDYLQGIEKQKSIRAFERLSALLFKKDWRVGRLDDRTVPGLVKCIKVWLELHDFNCLAASGNTIHASKDRSSLIVEIITTGYNSLTPAQRSLKDAIIRNGENYLVCKSLHDFLEKFDDLFDN